jgi:hypothetical protein
MILLKAFDHDWVHLIVPLPSNEWLVVFGNSRMFHIVGENGFKNKTDEYVEPIDNAAIQFSENPEHGNRRFVIITHTRQLHFFDLEVVQ